MRLASIRDRLFQKDIAGEKTNFGHIDKDNFENDLKKDMAGEKTTFDHIPHPNRELLTNFAKIINGGFVNLSKGF